MILARAGEAGAVHEGGEADALPHRQRRVDRGEAFALRVVVGDRHRAIEQRGHVDRIADHLADRARLPGADEIAAAQLVRRQTDGGRDAIHVALEREQALRRAEAAKRAVRRRVGRDGAAAEPHVRAEVRPGGVNRAARQHDRRQRAVGAAVDHEVDLHAEQPAVGRHRGPMPRSRRMPLGRRDHVLGAVVDELDRPAGLPRQQRGMRRRRSTGTPPCRRSRRRSPSARRGPSSAGRSKSAISALWT